MATILGLRDAEDFSSDRFQNWRRTILYLFPNGAAPLTALMSLTKPEPTDDPRFNWYEKALDTQRAEVNTIYAADATTVVIKSAYAKMFRAGHFIMNETTGDYMKITAVDSGGTSLTVVRSTGASGSYPWGTASVGAVGQYLIVVGNVNQEFGTMPGMKAVDPTGCYNYTQIFRTPFGISRTAQKTALKYDKSGPLAEAAREGLNYHSIEMEKAWIWGVRSQYTGDTYPERTTGGMLSFIPTANKVTVPNGNLTQALWDSYLEQLFRYTLSKNNEKLLLCGSGALSVLNSLAMSKAHIQVVPTGETFGMRLRRWETPFGTVFLKTHPLFNQHDTWRYNILAVDVPGLKYRPLVDSDTKRLTNRQANDADGRIDEYQTEAGLEVNHGQAHMYIQNIKQAA